MRSRHTYTNAALPVRPKINICVSGVCVCVRVCACVVGCGCTGAKWHTTESSALTAKHCQAFGRCYATANLNILAVKEEAIEYSLTVTFHAHAGAKIKPQSVNLWANDM